MRLLGRRSPAKLEFWSFLAMLLVLSIGTLWIARGVYQYRAYQMDMDEASHATRGLDFEAAFIHQDGEDLWHQLTKPHWYPPGNGLLLAGWFILFESSTLTARLYSTLGYFLIGILLWFYTRQIIPGSNPLFYLLPVIFLTSSRLYTLYAAQSMLEVPGTLFSFAALFFFTRALGTNSLYDHLSAAGFALLTFFTKYNYGLVILSTMGVCSIYFYGEKAGQAKKISDLFPLLSSWFVIAAVLFFWLVYLGEWQWLVYYSVARAEDFVLWSVSNFAYYPLQILAVTSNLIALVLLLVGAVLWIRWKSFPEMLLPLIIFFLVNLAVLTFVLYKIPRFGMTLFPPLWIGAAVAAAEIYDHLPKSILKKSYLVLLFAILTVLSLQNYSRLHGRLNSSYEQSGAEVERAYQYIAESIEIENWTDLKIILRGRTDSWSSMALRFYLKSRCMHTTSGCQVSVLDERDLNYGYPRLDIPMAQRNQRKRIASDSADVMVVFTTEPYDSADWTLVGEKVFQMGTGYNRAEEIRVIVFEREPVRDLEDPRVAKLWEQ